MIEERVPIVETIAAGKLTDNILIPLKQNGVKIIHKCTRLKHAQGAEQQGVDTVAILGFGADRHPGIEEISQMVQVPKPAQHLSYP